MIGSVKQTEGAGGASFERRDRRRVLRFLMEALAGREEVRLRREGGETELVKEGGEAELARVVMDEEGG
jgi:hypothetical protein